MLRAVRARVCTPPHPEPTASELRPPPRVEPFVNVFKHKNPLYVSRRTENLLCKTYNWEADC
jgi:hypothetical protein